MSKIKEDFLTNILESRVKDKESIVKASHNIDKIREKYGKYEKGFNSTEILRKIRDSKSKWFTY